MKSSRISVTRTTTDFSGLSAMFVNTTLKRNPEESHTKLLLNVSAEIMETNGIAVEHVHMASQTIPPGVYPDMTEHGYDSDDWPTVWERVKAVDILVVGTPLWLGEESSICRVLIERLYGMSGVAERPRPVDLLQQGWRLCDHRQRRWYQAYGDDNRLCSIASGFHHPAASRLWAGSARRGRVRPTAMSATMAAGWGLTMTSAQRNTTIMTWNLMHLAKILKDAGGIPNHGQRPQRLESRVPI